MSLTSALQTAQNSLLNVTRQTSIVSRNVTDAGNENYTRRQGVVESSNLGSRVVVVRSGVDSQLSAASLDALCKRFEIDNSSRTLHGALLDAQLLAEVYLELAGGRQPDLELAAEKEKQADLAKAGGNVRREPRPHTASEAELSAHSAFMEKITDPIWDK